MNSFFTGLMIVFAAALLQGSFLVPLYYTRTWKWENFLMIFSLFGMIIFNLLFALTTIPGLHQIYRAASPEDIMPSLIAGAVLGLGVIVLRIGVAAAGNTVGYAAVFGMMLGTGTLVPLFLLHAPEIMSNRGIIILIVLAIIIIMTVVAGYTGVKKDRKKPETGMRKSGAVFFSHISVKTGILFSLFAGLCFSSINTGFILSRPLAAHALFFGAPDYFAGNMAWIVLFITGGVINILYSIIIMAVNNSAHNFADEGAFKNFLLVLAMSFLWIISYLFYNMGASIMGLWGTTVGWMVFMTLSYGIFLVWRYILPRRHEDTKTRLYDYPAISEKV